MFYLVFEYRGKWEIRRSDGRLSDVSGYYDNIKAALGQLATANINNYRVFEHTIASGW